VLRLSKGRQESHQRCARVSFLSGQPEQLPDVPDLTSNIIAPHPPNLSLPHHVHRLITLNRSSGRVKFPEALLGIDPAFDRAMVLLDDVV
jgi:hypothetical protein